MFRRYVTVEPNHLPFSDNSKRLKQLHDGRSRARSLVPVALLAVCMFAVLYGNVSLYTDRM